MRVLLDECLPRRLKRELRGHEVLTVPEAGWAGKSNGELLQLAETEFDVFVTIDQNLPAQQNLGERMVVIILQARSNRYRDLEPLVPRIVEVLDGRLRVRVVRIAEER